MIPYVIIKFFVDPDDGIDNILVFFMGSVGEIESEYMYAFPREGQ
jgi:hypothetical protein